MDEVTTMSAVRKVTERMDAKEPRMVETKNQIENLLRRKPAVRGANLKHELDEVVNQWKKCRVLCNDFTAKILDFNCLYADLNSWLSDTARTFTVFTPIERDRMIQSQCEMQIMRKRFSEKQAQLKHFADVGNFLIGKFKSADANCIFGKLHHVQNEWDNLTDQLDEREQCIDAAISNINEKYEADLLIVRESLQNIDNELESLPTDLRKIDKFVSQLEEQRSLIEVLIADGVNARIGAISQQYHAVQKKIESRKSDIESRIVDNTPSITPNDASTSQEKRTPLWMRYVEYGNDPIEIKANLISLKIWPNISPEMKKSIQNAINFVKIMNNPIKLKKKHDSSKKTKESRLSKMTPEERKLERKKESERIKKIYHAKKTCT